MMKKTRGKMCTKCQEIKESSDFYISSTTLVNADGRISICKTCLLEIMDMENRTSIIEAMRVIDRPYLHNMFLVAKKSERKNLAGEYMRLIGMPQNRTLTYADSDFGDNQDEKLKSVADYKYESIGFTEEEMAQLIQFWGRGFSLDEYEFLQTEYEAFLNSYESEDSYTLQLLFQEAAHQRLTIKQKREKGEPVDKDVETLQKIFTSANIKPNQETGASSTDQATFGTLIKKFEEEEPIPKPDPEWEDVNKIRKYIDVFFKGHLMKMLGKENDTQEEYDKEISKHTVNPPKNEDDI